METLHGCTVCTEIGVEVIIFRGADRNRRRGFHNLAVFSQRLRRELDRVRCEELADTVSGTSTYELHFPALEVRQGRGRHLYTFAVDGKVVAEVHNGQSGAARREVRSRVTRGLRFWPTSLQSVHTSRQTSPMIPNAIVVAFDTRVRFEPTKHGHLKTTGGVHVLGYADCSRRRGPTGRG